MILCDRCGERLSVPRAQHNLALKHQKGVENLTLTSEWIHLCDECEVIAVDRLRALVEDLRSEEALYLLLRELS